MYLSGVIYEKEDIIMNALLNAGFMIKPRNNIQNVEGNQTNKIEEKKKRGRPKKQVVEEVVVQKKRGRPKKVEL